MRIEAMIELLIQAGRLLGHLQGAWRCGCKMAVVVEQELGDGGVSDLVEEIMDPDAGLKL